MTKKTSSLNFENALEELNEIIEAMEAGDMTLEDSLKKFEQGIKLTQQCQDKLKKAEQKVQMLIKKNASEELVDYDNEEDAE